MATQTQQDTKRCSGCKTDKPRSEFWRSTTHPSGLQPKCIPCGKEANRRNYERLGKAHQAERVAAWVRKNPFRYRANVVHHQMKRRGNGVAMDCPNPATIDDVETLFQEALDLGGRCPLCNVAMNFDVSEGKGLHPMNGAQVDHVHPISLGGKHQVSNIRIVCRACNQTRPDLAAMGKAIMGRFASKA